MDPPGEVSRMATSPAAEGSGVDCRWFQVFARGSSGGGEPRGHCSLGVHRILGRMVGPEYCSGCGLRVGRAERRPPEWAIAAARRAIERGIVPRGWEDLLR